MFETATWLKQFEAAETKCVSLLLNGVPPKVGSLDRETLEMLVRTAFQEALIVSAEKVIDAQNLRDGATREMDACHQSWNDFTSKLGAVAPAMKKAPLFQQAEYLADLISACASTQWTHDIGQPLDTICACQICVALRRLKGN